MTGRHSKNLSIRCFVKPFHCLKVVPLGHFLATFHKQGVALWAGTEFAKKAKNLKVNFNKKRPMIL